MKISIFSKIFARFLAYLNKVEVGGRDVVILNGSPGNCLSFDYRFIKIRSGVPKPQQNKDRFAAQKSRT